MDSETQQLFDESLKILDELLADFSIPRNIRKNIQNIRTKLASDKTPIDVRAASSVISLDEIVNDPNMPPHARTAVYMIMGKLEIVQKKTSGSKN